MRAKPRCELNTADVKTLIGAPSGLRHVRASGEVYCTQTALDCILNDLGYERGRDAVLSVRRVPPRVVQIQRPAHLEANLRRDNPFAHPQTENSGDASVGQSVADLAKERARAFGLEHVRVLRSFFKFRSRPVHCEKNGKS